MHGYIEVRDKTENIQNRPATSQMLAFKLTASFTALVSNVLTYSDINYIENSIVSFGEGKDRWLH